MEVVLRHASQLNPVVMRFLIEQLANNTAIFDAIGESIGYTIVDPKITDEVADLSEDRDKVHIVLRLPQGIQMKNPPTIFCEVAREVIQKVTLWEYIVINVTFEYDSREAA